MEEELKSQQQQQRKIVEQMNFMHQQIAEQQEKLKVLQTTKFNLTADQIIKNFNDIPPFSGEDHYKLKSFLNTVNDAETLCGENNAELKTYCLKKIINSKIIGKARNTIMEIPENLRTWNSVINQLKMKYKPKDTIHHLLYVAKNLRVSNLKELFIKLSEVKSKCSEICDFEEEDLFTYESIDRELVLILKSKLTPMLQIQINNNKSLFELDNLLCNTEIYVSEDAIKNEYKMNRNTRDNFMKNENIKNIIMYNVYVL